MFVPDEFALDFHHHNVVLIETSHGSWRPVFLEKRQLFCQVYAFVHRVHFSSPLIDEADLLSGSWSSHAKAIGIFDDDLPFHAYTLLYEGSMTEKGEEGNGSTDHFSHHFVDP